MATLSARDRFKQNVEDGGDQVVVEYFKRLNSEEASIDDLRKAVEFAAKVHGLQQPDKTDSLMSVSWTINGGNVTIGVSKPEPELVAAATEVIEDATIKEPSGSPDEPVKPSFEVPPVENLLDL